MVFRICWLDPLRGGVNTQASKIVHLMVTLQFWYLDSLDDYFIAITPMSTLT